MTAVNLNALGDLSQVKQPIVSSKDTKASSVKGEFSKVIKEKVAVRADVSKTGNEEAIKPPTKRTEYRNSGVSKRNSLSDGRIKQPQKNTKPVTPDEVLAGAAQILNTTQEELKAVLESLNMNVGDLSDRNNVAQLILTLGGEDDISSMLVDNGMLEAFNELNAFMEDILEANGMDADSFKDFVQNFGLKADEDGTAEEELTAGDYDGSEGTLTEVNEKGPEITVTDNRDSSESGMLFGSDKPSGTAQTDFTEGQIATAQANFINHLQMTEEVSAAEGTADLREIVYQVVEKVKVELNPDNTSLEMRLNPENLGRVSISITSKEGVMTAQINTENRQAKEAIESSLQILKENIEAKGIRVEAVEVRISDFNMADSRNSENGTGESRSERTRNSRRNSDLFANGAESAEEETEETILDPVSTVSFRA